MKTYLWTQSDSTTGKGVYVINGDLSYEDKTESQKEVSKYLFDFLDLEMCAKEKIKTAKREQKVCENLFVSYKKNEGYFISSNYVTKDEVGRRITFQFFCETDDIDVAIEELKKYSEKAQRQCDEDELKIVSELTKKNCASNSIVLGNVVLNSKMILVVGAIILLIVILLMANSNKNDNPKEKPKQEIEKDNPNQDVNKDNPDQKTYNDNPNSK